MTLMLACIIYWQAKEINRVAIECDPEGSNIDLALMEHISPIAWENVILYGEYVLDKNHIKLWAWPSVYLRTNVQVTLLGGGNY